MLCVLVQKHFHVRIIQYIHVRCATAQFYGFVTYFSSFFLAFHSIRTKVIINNNQLEFKNVELAQDGVYQCVAESKLGMIVSSTWVEVLGNYST